MASVRMQTLAIERPSGSAVRLELESEITGLLREMIGSRFADKRGELRGAGVFFKQTHRADEYELLRRMYGVVPKHIPAPLGLVVSNGGGSRAVHGYIMDHINGTDLEHPLRQWLFGFREEIIAQLRDVFDALHSAGIAHNDINPSNVMVRERDGRIFVIDPDAQVQRDVHDQSERAAEVQEDRVKAQELIETVRQSLRTV
ncbi:MAG: phosphotransferase [Candidatus Micrarchaeota archaeon]|nr:phosphotransferase [Candidatus Micrarchaeota archaeon]